MKTKFKYLKIVAVLILCFILFIFIYIGLKRAFVINEIEKHYEHLDNGIYVDKNANVQQISLIQDAISYIPEKYFVCYNEWTVVFTNNVFVINEKQLPLAQQMFNNNDILMYIDKNNKIINISTKNNNLNNIVFSLLIPFVYENEHLFWCCDTIDMFHKYSENYIEQNQLYINEFQHGNKKMMYASMLKECILNQEYIMLNARDAYECVNQIHELTPLEQIIAKIRFSINDVYLFLLNMDPDVSNYNKDNEFVDCKNDIPNPKYSLEAMKFIKDIEYVFENIDSFENTSTYYRAKNRICFSQDIYGDVSTIYKEVASFCKFYLLDSTISIKRVVYNDSNKLTIFINEEELQKSLKNRSIYNQKASNVLNYIYDGRESEIMDQISIFVINHSTYNINSTNSVGDFWNNNSGKCLTFALVFKQFADLVGIQNDIIIGYIDENDSNVRHAWNRITTSDGKYLYYDITRNILHRENPIHIQTDINNLY